jgi:hypothetical protein
VEEVNEFLDGVQVGWPTSQSMLQNIKQATARDKALQSVAAYTIDGWPEGEAVPSTVKPYQAAHGELAVVDGLITYGCSMVIPEGMRPDVPRRLHEGHQGKVKCRERAHAAVWWPGIGRDIDALVEACSHCMEHKPANRNEPLLPSNAKLPMGMCRHRSIRTEQEELSSRNGLLLPLDRNKVAGLESECTSNREVSAGLQPAWHTRCCAFG